MMKIIESDYSPHPSHIRFCACGCGDVLVDQKLFAEMVAVARLTDRLFSTTLSAADRAWEDVPPYALVYNTRGEDEDWIGRMRWVEHNLKHIQLDDVKRGL